MGWGKGEGKGKGKPPSTDKSASKNEREDEDEDDGPPTSAAAAAQPEVRRLSADSQASSSSVGTSLSLSLSFTDADVDTRRLSENSELCLSSLLDLSQSGRRDAQDATAEDGGREEQGRGGGGAGGGRGRLSSAFASGRLSGGTHMDGISGVRGANDVREGILLVSGTEVGEAVVLGRGGGEGGGGEGSEPTGGPAEGQGLATQGQRSSGDDRRSTGSSSSSTGTSTATDVYLGGGPGLAYRSRPRSDRFSRAREGGRGAHGRARRELDPISVPMQPVSRRDALQQRAASGGIGMGMGMYGEEYSFPPPSLPPSQDVMERGDFEMFSIPASQPSSQVSQISQGFASATGMASQSAGGREGADVQEDKEDEDKEEEAGGEDEKEEEDPAKPSRAIDASPSSSSPVTRGLGRGKRRRKLTKKAREGVHERGAGRQRERARGKRRRRK